MSPSTLSPHPRRTTIRPARGRSKPPPIARYTQSDGLRREIVTITATAGSLLLVDRLAGGLGDSRLLAHLAAEEPAENAKLISSMYLAESGGKACRRLTERDLHTIPFAAEPDPDPAEDLLRDEAGHAYRIQPVEAQSRQLRWTRTERSGGFQVISLRNLIGGLQAYQPALTITRRVIDAPPAGCYASRLTQELRQLERSPTVLNRRLREAVLHAIAHEQISMSEIAIRCGRVKLHANGHHSGETTWLARRVGLRADPSTGKPTPWIHQDVLALIARQGLGIAPVEVEAC